MLWIVYLSGNGLASYERRTKRLTFYSFKDREPRRPRSAAQRESTKTPMATSGWPRGGAAWSRSTPTDGVLFGTAIRPPIQTASVRTC